MGFEGGGILRSLFSQKKFIMKISVKEKVVNQFNDCGTVTKKWAKSKRIIWRQVVHRISELRSIYPISLFNREIEGYKLTRKVKLKA